MTMATPQKCPIDTVEDVRTERIPSGASFVCSRCGTFVITDLVWGEFQRLRPEQRVAISGWTRDQNDLGEPPTITSYKFELLRGLPVKPVADRIDRLLMSAITAQRTLGGTFALNSPEMIGRTYSANTNDVDALARYLEDEKLLKIPSDRNRGQVTARGFVKGQTANSIGASGFIAMWFNDTLSTARTAMETAVRAAGYDPVLVNAVEHVNKIDDEIVAQISKITFSNR